MTKENAMEPEMKKWLEQRIHELKVKDSSGSGLIGFGRNYSDDLDTGKAYIHVGEKSETDGMRKYCFEIPLWKLERIKFGLLVGELAMVRHEDAVYGQTTCIQCGRHGDGKSKLVFMTRNEEFRYVAKDGKLLKTLTDFIAFYYERQSWQNGRKDHERIDET